MLGFERSFDAARRAIWLPSLLVALSCACGPASAAETAAADPPEDHPPVAAAIATDHEPAELMLANRHIATLRAPAYGAGPADRAEVIGAEFDRVLERGGPMVVSTRPLEGGVAVLVDDKLVFRILDGDVNQEAGETAARGAEVAARNLQKALREVQESRSSQVLLRAAGYTLLATLALFALLWLVVRLTSAVTRRIRAYAQRRSESLVPSWSRQVVGHSGIGDLAAVPVRLVGWVLALLLVYEWAALVLEFFPYTRPWGEGLFGNLVDALGNFGRDILTAIPGLLFVALIFFVTRFIVRVVRAFFDGVQAQRIRVNWVDETTARPTGRLLTSLIWLFALVAAYPYIPGSDSEAFKGIGVFVGLMLSIGASGVVNQAVSGMMLMYTKALRPGEFVQVGDTEGTVTSVGFLTTRIQTLRNVEVTLPNAYLVSNETRNLSRLAANGGMKLTTAVTIGYDTPWRQVHALLQMAAARTAKVVKEDAPVVRQTALQDFYVQYTLIATIADPRDKVVVLDELHGHIQDVFNEYGVQIMSPNYEADPEGKKWVPKEQWYLEPAVKSAPAASAPAAGRAESDGPAA